MSILTKQYNNRVQTSTKLTPIQGFLKKDEEYIYYKLLDRQKKYQPKLQVNDLVLVADLKKTFSERDTTNWLYKLYETMDFSEDTIPSYHTDNLPERFNEALLKKNRVIIERN